MRPHNRTPMGIALIEALVALAVMAFGMLAVAGVQVTLRQNADIAKQRSEAVRLAQAEIERWRAFTSIAGAAGTVTYGSIVEDLLGSGVSGSNAQFTIKRAVDEPADSAYKMLRVDVSWVDRSGQPQNVRLSTAVQRVAPELSGTLIAPSGAFLGSVHRAIPPGTTPLSSTTSGFRPPQPPGGVAVAWQFDIASALIRICTTNVDTSAELTADNMNCLNGSKAQLLSGYVNFAVIRDVAPSPGDAENPLGARGPATVQVVRRNAPVGPDVSCFTEPATANSVRYFCAIPVADPALQWSGRSVVDGLIGLTNVEANADAANLRVCRYTRYADNRTVASGTIKNSEHPLDYVAVKGPLANQNFLIIRAGNGALPAFPCPLDDPATLMDTTTFAHPLS